MDEGRKYENKSANDSTHAAHVESLDGLEELALLFHLVEWFLTRLLRVVLGSDFILFEDYYVNFFLETSEGSPFQLNKWWSTWLA